MIRPLTVLALAACLVACEEKRPTTKAPAGSIPGSIDTNATVKAAKDKAVASASDALTAAQAKIDTLKQKAAGVAPDAKAAFDQTVKTIDEQYAAVKGQLDGLKSAGADAWQKMSTDLNGALAKLNDAIKSAMDKYAK